MVELQIWIDAKMMTIKEIIGKGKLFEPPFKVDPYGIYIFDNTNQMIAEVRGYGYLIHKTEGEEDVVGIQKTIAEYIVEQLNKI